MYSIKALFLGWLCSSQQILIRPVFWAPNPIVDPHEITPSFMIANGPTFVPPK